VRFYWRIQSIPELTGIHPHDRVRVYREAGRRALGHWQTWLGFYVGFIFCGVCAAAGIQCVLLLGQHGSILSWRSPGFYVALVLASILGGAAGGAVFAKVFLRGMRAEIRQYLKEQGFPFPDDIGPGGDSGE
jgi:hypothetical protein